MIISLRGTNGAGKSTIIRNLMDLYDTRITVAYPEQNKRRPMGYICIKDNQRRLFVPGHYEIANGGIDTLPSLDYAYELVLKHHEYAADVIYEGMNLSDGTKGILKMHAAKLDVRVIFIDHPIDACIQSVRDRGHGIAEKTIISIHKKLDKQYVQLRAAKVVCFKLSRLKAFTTAMDWLLGGDYVLTESKERLSSAQRDIALPKQ